MKGLIFYMKQIIPFKKELLFKTKVSEITSISLEHTLSLKNDDLISGEFIVSGDYKMTEGSINREVFNFRLPFDIALDSRYNVDNIIIDIDNFYYEIVNNESLQVNIDVYIEGEKIIEEIKEEKEEILEESLIEDKTIEVLSNKDERNNHEEIEDLFKEEYTPAVELNKPKQLVMEVENEYEEKNEFNIFQNIDNSDTYVTYYVYIVKEEDTIDKILEKYNTTRDSIACYNNLDNIKPGTKLIIPSNNE